MNRTHWVALLALVVIVMVVLLFALGGFWILSGAHGGMIAWGATWRGMMSRVCPSCGGMRGLLGRPRTLLFLGLLIVLYLGQDQRILSLLTNALGPPITAYAPLVTQAGGNAWPRLAARAEPAQAG